MLPWSIKVFWAPWIDRHGSRSKGHYGELDYSNAVVVRGGLGLPVLFVMRKPRWTDVSAAVFCSFTQYEFGRCHSDVATDGLAVNIFKN